MLPDRISNQGPLTYESGNLLVNLDLHIILLVVKSDYFYFCKLYRSIWITSSFSGLLTDPFHKKYLF